MADDYFSYTLRDAAWQAVAAPQKQAGLWEAQQRLLELEPDPTKTTCGDNFAGAWIAASSELALALINNPDAIIAGGTAQPLAVRRNKLGDLEQEFGTPADGMSSRYGLSSPLLLQKFPWLGEIIGCWISRSGSNVLNRYRS